MEIDYIKGPRTDKIFGISKYQMEIIKRLNIDLNVVEYDSIMQNMERIYNSITLSKSSNAPINDNHSDDNNIKLPVDNKLFNFLVDMGKSTLTSIDRYKYTIIVKKRIKKGNVKHITSPDFAYLLKSIKMEKSIVTCYDLIPWIYDKNRSFLWKNNMNGLKYADKIITISEFSKNEIIKYINYPEEKIDIVYPAVDHSVYFENRDNNILKQSQIPLEGKIILYVGSETPRQNLDLLIRAFYRLKKKIPEAKLLKIGDPLSFGARKKLLNIIMKYGLEKDILFVGYVLEEDLPKWYNASDLLVYPCRYAGFGLPPLEAMACGTPVITANTTSLPEVVGDAGIMVDPDDDKFLADEMYKILTNSDLRQELVKKGIGRAKLFNWKNSAEKTFEIYNIVHGD